MAGIELARVFVNVRGAVDMLAQDIEQARPIVAAGLAGIAAYGSNVLRQGFAHAMEAEQMEQALKVMLGGSAEKAKAMLAELTDFAAKTPFEMPGLSRAMRVLLQFKVPVDDVMDTMKMLGDVAAATNGSLSHLAVIFGQITSLGRLQGQDLMQLINFGFNPLSIISEKTGKSMSQLKDEMSKGAISADMVKDAFKTATSEGGQFYNMMEAQSLTLSGRMSTLRDDIGLIQRGIAEGLMPTAKKMTDLLIVFTGAMRELVDQSGALAGHIVSMVTAVSALTAGLKGAGMAARFFGKSLTMVLATTMIYILPLVALGTALGILVDQAEKLWDHLSQLPAVQEALATGAERLNEAWKLVGVAAEILWKKIGPAFQAIAKRLADVFGVDLKKAPATLEGMVVQLIDIVTRFALDVAEWLQVIAENWETIWEKLPGIAMTALRNYLRFLPAWWSFLWENFKNGLQLVVDIWEDVWPLLPEIGMTALMVYLDVFSNWSALLNQLAGYGLRKVFDTFVEWGGAVVQATFSFLSKLPEIAASQVAMMGTIIRVALTEGPEAALKAFSAMMPALAANFERFLRNQIRSTEAFAAGLRGEAPDFTKLFDLTPETEARIAALGDKLGDVFDRKMELEKMRLDLELDVPALELKPPSDLEDVIAESAGKKAEKAGEKAAEAIKRVLDPGRYGIVDFGKKIQDSLLKAADPAEKRDEARNSLLEQGNKKQDAILEAVKDLKPMPAVLS